MSYPKGSDSERFVEELEGEFEVEHYNGYAWYEGPGARADSLYDLIAIIRLTTVAVKWDTLGEGYIVYPTYGDKEI